jgi:acyl carrier protein
MDQKALEKLTSIFRSLFNQNNLVLRDDMTARDVPGWDSFNHINLIIQIEEEFGIRFTNEEVSQLSNVGELKTLIREKLA